MISLKIRELDYCPPHRRFELRIEHGIITNAIDIIGPEKCPLEKWHKFEKDVQNGEDAELFYSISSDCKYVANYSWFIKFFYNSKYIAFMIGHVGQIDNTTIVRLETETSRDCFLGLLSHIIKALSKKS